MKILKLKEREAFSTFWMRFLYRLIYPFFHCKCVLPRSLTESDEPVVFIANHYNVFGPVSFMASMPIDSSAWVNEELITPQTTETAMIPGLSRMLPFLKEERIRRLSRRLSRLACRVILRFGPIPVSRKEPGKLAATLRESVSTLEGGRCVTIFPESGIPEYSLTSVSSFYSGFAVLGRLYWRKTGKSLKFWPCYIDEQHHEISFGEPVSYRPENMDVTAECTRISDELNDTIRQKAASFHGIKKSERTPVRKTTLLFCNILRLLLLIPTVILLYSGIIFPALVLYGASQGLRIVVNLVRGTLPATNHGSFILSHGITLLTDTFMMFRLAQTESSLYPLSGLLAFSLLLFVFMNMHTYFHANRCAGTTYFDTLTANLFCIFIFSRFAGISLSSLASSACRLVLIGTVICANLFELIFNLRVLTKDSAES